MCKWYTTLTAIVMKVRSVHGIRAIARNRLISEYRKPGHHTSEIEFDENLINNVPIEIDSAHNPDQEALQQCVIMLFNVLACNTKGMRMH